MICTDCLTYMYPQALTVTVCEVCGSKIISPHLPGYKLCPSCSLTQSRCQQCGGSFDEQISLFDKDDG